MTQPSPPRALVCAAGAAARAELAGALADLAAVPRPLAGVGAGELAGVRLVVIDGGADEAAACRRLRAGCEGGWVPVLFVAARPDVRVAALREGADVCLVRPFAPEELAAQAQALLRLKDAYDRQAAQAAEAHRVNERLLDAYRQIDQELELAQRLQASFLPRELPRVARARFAVHYLLCGRVGGDFYDAFRLDERHVGFYVADAMGHGVPASLLTMFVKRGVRGKEVFDRQYRLVPPGEVLQRLNRELVEQRLAEQPFVTMAYGLLDHAAGVVRLARAGHPYPVLVPREGEPAVLRQEGLLLGVAEAKYVTTEHRLGPGDKLLLYSDGVDGARDDEGRSGAEALLACARRHRGAGAQELVGRVAGELFGKRPPGDDLTVLAVEWGG